jgi:hypothetical protein
VATFTYAGRESQPASRDEDLLVGGVGAGAVLVAFVAARQS